MKISTINTTYMLTLDQEQKDILSKDKKLIWKLRQTIYSTVQMYQVTLQLDNDISFTLYAEEDNAESHSRILQTVKQFFEDNKQ